MAENTSPQATVVGWILKLIPYVIDLLKSLWQKEAVEKITAGDILERRRVEAALKEVNEEYAKKLASTPNNWADVGLHRKLRKNSPVK